MNRTRRIDLAGDAIEAFIRWYSSTGHWIHDGRAEAAQIWITRGITTLAPAPVNAVPLLADWAEADPLPALIMRLRADEIAMKTRAAADGALWLPLEANNA